MPKLEIREERCKSCGLCIEFCPKGCLEITDRFNPSGYNPVGWMNTEECTGCAICARMCPDVVIEVFK
ncbi:MAG: tungsten formylmethanofuran dehydrogenase [Deltaproteobacteria bacterium]|nr:MAG: tungsten formylmethanofuran dehydrogenase [Deltaproteobacteria bacterium]